MRKLGNGQRGTVTATRTSAVTTLFVQNNLRLYPSIDQLVSASGLLADRQKWFVLSEQQLLQPCQAMRFNYTKRL